MIPLWPSLDPIETQAQARAADGYTINTLGVPSMLLMENAGRAVAHRVITLMGQLPQAPAPKVAIFVGPGNNGADALVCARHLLAHDFTILIYFSAARATFSPELSQQLALIENIIAHHSPTVRVQFVTELEELKIQPMVIVDGIFGAGLSRAPEGASLAAIERINYLRESGGEQCRVLSIDVPSGLGLEARKPLGAVVRAHHTISFGHLKRCHISEPTKQWVGTAESADIGLYYPTPATNFWLKPSKKPLNYLLKPVPNPCHKGDFGHVAVLEGHPNFMGASRLSARAALRVGSGLVSILSARADSFHPGDLAEFMKKPASEANLGFWARISCLIVGPGLSTNKSHQEQALGILNTAAPLVKNLVLDADALALVHEPKVVLKANNLICTPHPQEAARLLGISTQQVEDNRFLAIESLAQLPFNPGGTTIWVLKGATTLIRQEPHGTIAFTGDAPILATGGSGDILAGAIGGLLAQTPSPLAAAVLALSLQLCAARHFSHKTKGILPSELADLFPSLLQRIEG